MVLKRLVIGITCVFTACIPAHAQTSTRSVVISQVYGGGGNSGATLRNDFVELFNRGAAPVDITGWSVQYAAATGNSWATTSLSGSIAPGQYYLVEEAQGSAGSTALPTPDAMGGINLSATSGKVALVNASSPLTVNAPTGSNVIGLVGYGAADFSEGATAPMLDNTTALVRGNAGCLDNHNNSTDFSTATPKPRNTSSPHNPCAIVTLPSITSAGVTNAASFLAGPVAPGELVTIFGLNIGPAVLTGLELTSDGSHVTNALAGTQVLFDGTAAPLIYVSGTQVAAIVPYAVAGKSSTNLQVAFNGQPSNQITLPVGATAPGVFTVTQSGSGQTSILNQDYTVNSALNPAPTGTFVSIFGTGGGQTSPSGEDGKITGSNLATANAQVTAQVAGIGAPVSYAGSAPGLVSGVLQINAQLPTTIPTADAAPLQVQIGTADSQPGATIAVRNANPALVCGVACGEERWPVKTLTDEDAAKVNLSPQTATVNYLLSLSAPAQLPEQQRIAPIELQTFQVTARLVGFVMETDMDFHVVIADPADLTHTMIVEIPSPNCANACRSGHSPDFVAARTALAQRFGAPTSSFQQLPSVLVSVTGTAFFDSLHGQTGVAANGIELHPVMRIQFLE